MRHFFWSVVWFSIFIDSNAFGSAFSRFAIQFKLRLGKWLVAKSKVRDVCLCAAAETLKGGLL